MHDLDGGFEKVNRYAVVAFQDDENQLLCITKTKDATGKDESGGRCSEGGNYVRIGFSQGVVRVKL